MVAWLWPDYLNNSSHSFKRMITWKGETMKNDEVEVSTKSHKRGLFKKLKWILILSAGCGLLIFFGLPAYLSSAAGTNLLLGKINQSVDGQVQMEDFSIGWFKGIELSNLSYDDSAGNASLQVARLKAKPSYMNLLGGKISLLKKTIVERPRLYYKVTPLIDQKAAPQLPAAAKSKDQPSQSEYALDYMDLEVSDGEVTVELAADTPQTVSLKNISSKVYADAGETSFDVSMGVNDNAAQQATLSAKGAVTTPSEKGWTLADGDFSVQISKLELASLKPLFVMAGRDMDMAGQLNADASIAIAKGKLDRLKADARIDNFSQGSGDQRIAFQSPVIVSAATSGSVEAITIDALDIKSDFCKLHCSGTQSALDYEVDADLAQTLRFAGQFKDLAGYGATGALKAKGNVNLTDDQVAVTTAASVAKLVVKKDDLQTPVTDAKLNLDCAFDKKQQQLRLASMDMTATPGTVKVSNLNLPIPLVAGKSISAETQVSLDLAGVWPFVQVFADVPADLKLAGMLNSIATVSTQGSQIRLLTENTRLQNLLVACGKDEPFRQDDLRLIGDVLLDTEAQTIDIRKLDLQKDQGQSLINVSKGKVEKKVTSDTTRLKGDFEAAYDLQTLSVFGAAFMPDGLTLAGRRKDILRFESTYPTDKPEQMPKNLNAAATFGFEKAVYNGLNFGKTEMAVEVIDGVADFAIPQAVVNDGKFQFAGQVNLNEPVRRLRLKEPMRILENIHITEELTNNMLKYLSPAFAKQTNISGFATLSCEQLEIPFDADKKNEILIDGTVQVDKMRLKAIGAVGDILERTDNRSVFDATLLPSRILLQDGVMQYDEMEFHFDQYPIGFFGKIYLDKKLDMQVRVPYKFDVEHFRFPAVRVGDDLSQRLALPVDGTVDSPRVRLDKLFDAILKKHQPDLIQRGLEELLKNL